MQKLLALLLAIAALAAACSSDDSSEDSSSDDASSEDSGAEDSDGSDDSAADGGATGTSIDIDAVLAADLDNCGDEPTGDPIVVGMAMDFSEVSGFADQPGSEAVKHLADLMNCVGGFDGSPIEVEVRDVQGDPDVAPQATQELLDAGAAFLVGPPFADFGQPILQTTAGSHAVFFAASTEPSLPDAAVNSFLVSFDDTAQATAAAEWSLAEGYTRAITFSSPGPYFGYNPEIFTEVFTAGGGEIVTDQTYVPVEDVDFSAQVNEIAGVAENNEVVYSAMLANQVTALRGQLEGQGLDAMTYVGTDAFEATGLLSPDFIGPGEGMVHTTHAYIEPGGRIDQLQQSYAAATGEELASGSFAGLYGDAMLLGLQAMRNCGCTNPAEIGAAVGQISGFDGFTGPMGYAGTNGIPNKPVSIHKIVDGEDTLLAEWE